MDFYNFYLQSIDITSIHIPIRKYGDLYIGICQCERKRRLSKNKCTEAWWCQSRKMGIDIDTWRKRIGGFSQPFKGRFPHETLKLKHLSLYIRVCLFLLLVVQGVEANPGPNPAPSFGTSSGPARGGSTSGPRNSIGAANKPSGYANASRGRGANASGRGASRRSTTYDNSQPASDRVLRSADASQKVMNAWLNSDRRSSGFGYNTQS